MGHSPDSRTQGVFYVLTGRLPHVVLQSQVPISFRTKENGLMKFCVNEA